VVKQGQQVPGAILVAGNPAKKIRDVSQKDRDLWDYTRKLYGNLTQKYLVIGMEKIETP
jgi:carbonic anhydrase/acetyltransferase-like protein (isoleucine patch superfamily)